MIKQSDSCLANTDTDKQNQDSASHLTVTIDVQPNASHHDFVHTGLSSAGRHFFSHYSMPASNTSPLPAPSLPPSSHFPALDAAFFAAILVLRRGAPTIAEAAVFLTFFFSFAGWSW
jgi:hypothetical protein